MKLEVKKITPDMAREMLEANTHNRRLDAKTVSAYALDMKNGRWEIDSPTPITIGEDGVLKDGQHRLSAVIESGVPITFVVATVDSAVSIFDTQKVRTTNQWLRLNKGFDNNLSTPLVTGTARLHIDMGRGVKVTNTEIAEYVSKNEEEFYLMNDICRNKGVAGNAITRNVPVAHAVYCAIKCGVDVELLKEMIKTVNTGFYDKPSGSTAIVMRNQIINDLPRNMTSAEKVEVSGMFEGYIEAYVAGKALQRRGKTVKSCYSEKVYAMEAKKGV